MVRLSVGIEGIRDLISELDDSLYAATGLGSLGAPILNSESVIRRVAGDPTIEDGPGGKRRSQVIAVVGLSPDPGRPSHRVARKLQRQGYRIIPVNPKADVILGQRAFASLDDVDMPVDVVQVFRAPEHTPDIARAAAGRPEKPVFWMQEGIENEEAAQIAADAGSQGRDESLPVERSAAALGIDQHLPERPAGGRTVENPSGGWAAGDGPLAFGVPGRRDTGVAGGRQRSVAA